ncbi:penicillin-binding protein activator LpoB, partial [Desulfobacteraceae bacterium SEEP-SAG9]
MKYRVAILIVGIMLLSAGCASTPKVERKEIDTTIDLSGRWNDTDSRLVSEEMIQDCLSRPWMGSYKDKHGGRIPTLIVGRV